MINANQSNKENDYTESYRAQLNKAFLESKELGFKLPRLISPDSPVSNATLSKVSEIATELSGFFDMILPGYWGNSCQTLCTNLFAHFNFRGINAQVILGTVIINGTDEFEASIDSLREEVRSDHALSQHQAVHAWISLGGDTIVDAALPPRLVKNYGAPASFADVILIGRANEFIQRYKLEYRPLLAGTEFFAKTNPPDPMELLNEMRSGKFGKL